MIREIEEIIGLDCSNIIKASAKMGLGIEDVLESIVKRIPPPKNTVQVSRQVLKNAAEHLSASPAACMSKLSSSPVR